ncbi:hypothetical protein [Flavobacterium sp. S87F.05.LMB.W.Kidney.N]|uniref:hypothetical protein n=1 Tax=Flavobacterium sp. S87F.05.LMB.W.Kidney.N TaxID=1278758 RepID=UPI001065A9BE|nr:hypothetical protein [Flavobacterium sp. S87F.05.LMB.W.Kidney.N]TDX08376.1 hypothetical protein EDB96_4309 [Flavobacterium sp. S87F.05.LMB.W.Kidney.N]
MNIKFERIKRAEFKNKQNSIVLFEKTSDDNFGEIQWNGCVFQFGWRGDFILPVVKEIDLMRFGLGVDFNFVIVDIVKKEIIYKIELDDYFINFIVKGNVIYIASELKVIQLEIDNFEILNEFYLPEIFDDFVITNDSIIASCIDNQTINLSNF